MTRPKEGEIAPEFSLPTQTDNQTITLSALRGKVVVLFFYPKDDTPGCTKEACSFRDMGAEYAAANAVILGVSRDDSESHKKFAEKFTLNFPLLADTDGQTTENYGVWVEKNNYGKKSMGIERTTFVIAADGTIAKVFPRVAVDGHGDAVLNFVKGLSG